MSSEVRAFADAMHQAAAELDDLTRVNQHAADLVLGDARIPRDTGYLEAHTTALGTADGFALVSTAPYAGYVHARNPFLTDPLNRDLDAVLDLYGDEVEEILRGI